MRHIFYLSLILLMYIPAQAQNFGDEETTEEKRISEMKSKEGKEKWKAKRIKAEKAFCIDKKSRQQFMCGITTYDSRGNYTGYTGFNVKGDTTYYSIYRYNDSDDVKYHETRTRKKPVERTVYVFDSVNNVVERTTYEGNKATWRHTWSYNSAGQETVVTYYRTKDLKMSWRYEYDYYPDGKKKEARSYNRKNKLMEVMTYECGEIGKTAEELAKVESKVCIRQEFDSEGNKIKIIEEIDRKGSRISRTEKYDPEGNLLSTQSTWPGGKVYFKMDFKYYPGSKLPSELKYFSRIALDGKKQDAHYQYAYNSEEMLEKIIKKERRKKPVVRTYQYEKF